MNLRAGNHLETSRPDGGKTALSRSNLGWPQELVEFSTQILGRHPREKGLDKHGLGDVQVACTWEERKKAMAHSVTLPGEDMTRIPLG